jgi:pilus assembly protein CpaB
MNFVRLFVMAVAAGSGYLAFQLVMDNETPAAAPLPPQEETLSVQVLVVNRDIPLGGKLTDTDVEWVDWPENAVPSGVVMNEKGSSAREELLGSIAKAPIFSGEPIRAERLINTDRGYMAAILPKGKRAIAVKVEQETAAGGFILPGDKVDLILTRKFRNRSVTSETILENIRVLAIDSTTAGESETKNLSPQRTATLEMTLIQSEIIAQSQQIGTIALALRSAEDSADDAVVEQVSRRDVKFVRLHPDRWSVGEFQGEENQ